MLEEKAKVRRPHWERHCFVFFVVPVSKKEHGWIVKPGDKYSEDYPLEMYITRYPQYYMFGSSGCYSWSPLSSDMCTAYWEYCDDWKIIVDECIEERERREEWMNNDRKRGIQYNSPMNFPDYSHIKY